MKSAGLGLAIGGVVLSLLSFIPLLGGLLSLLGILLLIAAGVIAIVLLVQNKESKIRPVFVLIIVAAVLLFRLFGMFSSTPSTSSSTIADTSNTVESVQTPPIEISPKKLYAEFESNKVRAKDDYAGKSLKIAGLIKAIDKDELNNNYVVNISLGEDILFDSIECRFGLEHAEEIKALNKGDTVTIVGQSPWLNISSVSLSECRLVSPK